VRTASGTVAVPASAAGAVPPIHGLLVSGGDGTAAALGGGQAGGQQPGHQPPLRGDESVEGRAPAGANLRRLRRPPKKTTEEHAREQARFLNQELEPALEQARAGRGAVFFVDAAHFVWAPFLGALWCLARLFVRSATGRKRYNVLGALDAVTHEVIRVCNEGYVTAETVCTLLRTLAGAGLGVPITMVLDNARYQRCELVRSLARQLGIRLLFLPSYSPNLNLIERLWRFVRKQSLNSTWFDSFEQFQAAIDDCLNKMATDHQHEAATLFVH
jgi:transposase